VRFVVVRNVVEHEAAAFTVLQDPAFAAHALRHENAADRRRPDHAGRVELDELHVDKVGARAVGDRVTIARTFPAVARDLERAAHAAGREHDGLGDEHVKAPALAVVGERT
jgi:hypothetical protein